MPKAGCYKEASGPEASFQPGSHRRVLFNRRGLTSKRAMHRAEAEALAKAQERYYARLTANTRFTADLLRRMHRDWLGDLYDWAGEYRRVELEKSGFRWPPAERVPENMAAFMQGTLRRNTPCRPGPLPEVAQRLAEVHAELLLIHPFRDGSGVLLLAGDGSIIRTPSSASLVRDRRSRGGVSAPMG